MKVNTLLTTARMKEVGETVQNILKAYDNCALCKDANLQRIIDLLAQKNNQLIAAFEKCKAHSALEKCDEERNKAFKNLYYYLKACTLSPMGIDRTIAESIFPLFEKHGICIDKLAYEEQNSQTKHLCKELECQDLMARTKRNAQLDDMLESLKKAQANFLKVHNNYSSQIKLSAKEQSAKELKNSVLEIINEQLVMYMRAMEKTFPETHAAFATKLANEIDKTNQNIKNRNPHSGVFENK